MKDRRIIKCFVGIAVYICFLLLSVFLASKVKINYDISKYLDKDSDTSIALAITDKEFGKNTSFLVMAVDVDEELANEIFKTLSSCEGVMFVSFDSNDINNYHDNKALYTLLIYGDDYSPSAQEINKGVQEVLKDNYPNVTFIYGGGVETYNSLKEAILKEMVWILVIAVAIVIVILLLTLKSWIEPFILLISCGFAIIINRGTNLVFGEISYVINAIAPILQLALSIDYSIVLINKYKNKKEEIGDKYESMEKAIREVIRPISASALTTIAGLLALLFMSFNIGFDIGIVLMKGIVISSITSLTLLPALVLVFDEVINKTTKKAIKLDGAIFSKITFKGHKLIAIIAIIIIIPCAYFAQKNVYTFSGKETGTIYEEFGSDQTVMVLYENENGSYDKEIEFENILNGYTDLDNYNPLYRVVSYSNTLEKEYTYEEVTNSFDISEDDARALFLVYHLSHEGEMYDPIKAIDLINFLYEGATKEGSLISGSLTPESKAQIIELHEKVDAYSKLLKSDNYTRILLSLKTKKESKKTSEYLDYLQSKSKEEFGEDTYVAGEICSVYDMQKAFKTDNIIISVVTIVSIFLIVLLIFRSLFFPVVLVAIVQGAIWLDFTTTLIDTRGGLFFLSYLMATCILMGSTIDYGILLSSEYVRLRKTQDKKTAIANSIKVALPTLFTSGLIMVVCGFVISIVSTQYMISSVGLLIGKGTSFAIILVIIVLPSILYSLDGIMLKLTMKSKKKDDE